MSKDLNLCQFIGRLGNDPEIRFSASGAAVANLSLACSDDYKDKTTGQKVDQTNWIKVVAFGRLAEIIQQYVKKGSQIHISGKQVTRKWQAQDGTDRYSTEIVANEMQMLGGRAEATEPRESGGHQGASGSPPRKAAPPQGQPMGVSQQAVPATSFDDDDIPW